MNSMKVIAIFFLLPVAASAGTFVETFNDKDLQDWQALTMVNLDAAQAAWEVLDGELQGISQTPLVSLLTVGNKTWKDYSVEFDVKPMKKHGPGSIAIAGRKKQTWIITCMIGDMEFPEPESKATCFSGDFHDNRYVVLNREAASLLRLETWAHLKLSVHGTIFTFWINGKQILEARDQQANFLTGGIGFGLTNYTARFDNIIITGDTIPNKGRLAVTPQGKLATTWGNLKRF